MSNEVIYILTSIGVLCTLGRIYKVVSAKRIYGSSSSPHKFIVQLRYAYLPSVLKFIAVHYWFIVFDPSEKKWTRWEVWQYSDNYSGWHLRKDLFSPDRDVDGGYKFHVAEQWEGKVAQRINAVLEEPDVYPFKKRYFFLGPNSNTYPAWVLKKAKVSFDLQPLAIGKDYTHKILGMQLTTTRTGLQLEAFTSLVGFKIGLKEGVEIHILFLTFGVGVWPPCIKTPFGRIGCGD